MQYNRKIHICTGGSRKAVYWPACEILWSEFVDRLKNPVRGTETLETYLGMKKSQQDDLKDVGGFVGGILRGGRRKSNLVAGRDLITLDLDSIPAGKTADVLRRVDGLGCAAVVYSTRKHAEFAPRLRIVIPLDKTASADEYEPCARKLASIIEMEFCDPTTFEAHRLMYWPSCSSDSQYVYRVYDKPFCSLDGVLSMYADWHDANSWPQVPGADAAERRRLARQEDPTTKDGIIGAFCRTHSITEAMEKFLPGTYEETATPGRYTYTGGSTSGGAIVYDGDRFLYSHHATDPCSGLLVNAFDLVRLHRFSDEDADAKEGTPVNRLPSFSLMRKLALSDTDTASLLRKERYEKAKETFPVGTPGDETPEWDAEWRDKLEVDGNGNYRKTINNVVIILEHDPELKDKIVTDEFASCGMVLGAVPWNPETEKRRWTDADDAGYYRYLEQFYGITGKDKMDNALLIVTDGNRINDVRQYLEGISWDGTKRLEALLPDYLGADDTPYTRAVMRKSLCAAVARAIQGGVKYDYMPIFTGPQGIGKSTFLAILGGEWFSDSLTTFDGKDAAETIQGTWVNEVGELTAMNRQETNAVKQFLSRREDIYRAAYGRRAEKYPRRCVFFGTSNDSEFLKDATGNRRFWPVDVGLHPPRKSVWTDLPAERDQIWAEARVYWALGEKLFLPPEIEILAQEQQEAHRETSGREGIVRAFLAKKIPENWDNMDPTKRRMFWGNPGSLQGIGPLVPRKKVCAVEIWVECFGGDPKTMKRSDTNEINNILINTDGWSRNKSSRRFGPYGTQRGFEKS